VLLLRTIKYSVEKSVSGKTAGVVATIEDRFGREKISFSRVRGWRRELALKYLKLDPQGWTDDAARAYVGLEVLKCAKNRDEALKFLQMVKELSQLEVHFWSTKFLNGNKKAKRAWRAFYG
jgi:hypothetical protein